MSTTPPSGTHWAGRVDDIDWVAVATDLNSYGCALTGPLLSPAEAAAIAALYDEDSRFRSTVVMARHRFGEGEYRYFTEPFPDAVVALKEALYPRLLPIAWDWWSKLGRATPWPDTLAEWLQMCHAAGQSKPTPILLKYGEGDWNALHRDLYGETRDRPVRSARGWSAAPVRHGVSVIRSGQRITLGLIFHDAA